MRKNEKFYIRFIRYIFVNIWMVGIPLLATQFFLSALVAAQTSAPSNKAQDSTSLSGHKDEPDAHNHKVPKRLGNEQQNASRPSSAPSPMDETDVLLEKFERIGPEMGGGFKLRGKDMEVTPTIVQVTYDWELNGKEGVLVGVLVSKTEQAASQQIQNAVGRMSVGPNRQLEKFGDEAYLYQSAGTDACMIIARSGKIVIQLNAPTEAIGIQFVKALITAITGVEEAEGNHPATATTK